MAGASLSTPSTGPVMTAGVPKPAAPKPSKPAPVQVKAHTRAAPTSKPKAQGSGNPLLNPNQPLSGQALLNAARQLSALQTRDPINELKAQIAANNRQTQGTIAQTGGFYNQLEPYVQSSVNQQGQIASGLNSQLQGIGNNTQSQLQGIGQGAMASLAKYAPDAAASGATTDLAAQIARQQGLAAQQAGTYQAYGANQGAANQSFGASQLGTYGLQGQEALRNIAQSGTVRNEPLSQKIAGLVSQQGALTASNLGKLRQQEINNQVTRAGLGLKQQGLQVTAQNDQARNQIAQGNLGVARQRANTAANQQAFNNNPLKVGSPAWERVQNETGKTFANDPNAVGSAAWARVQSANARSTAKSGSGGTKPLTTLENNAANAKIGYIINAIRTWQQSGIKNSKGVPIEPHPTDAQMRQVLSGTYASPLIEAGFDLLGYGVLTPQTARALHSMGIRGTIYQGKPAQVKAVNQVGGKVSGTATPSGSLF